ncbi:S8 family serine peptidase [candidate division KSB1 bacterium]|nr:S8 family serine peptidase [candidate division KSB1 bacterium]
MNRTNLSQTFCAERQFYPCPVLFLYLFILIICFFVPFQAIAQDILIKLNKTAPALGKTDGLGNQITGLSTVDNVLRKVKAKRIMQAFPLVVDGEYESIGLDRWIKISIPQEAGINEALVLFESLSDVEYAQSNHVYKMNYVPQDPDITQQWALEKVGAYQAWDNEKGSPDVLIAVIDTGVDYTHPDLAKNIWINPGEDLNGNGIADNGDYNQIDDDGNGYADDILGWDFTDAPNYPDGGDYLERDNDPIDEMGHGTGISGIIAAVMDNHIGIAGLAPGCRIMSIRFATSRGYGEEDDAASAILYAIQNGAQIINMSWGDTNISRIMDDIFRYAAQKGVVLVASAGNSSTDEIHYPSGFNGTISVGAVDEQDNLAGFSNYGPCVDLVAPGINIYTTTLDEQYNSVNGTSFAAPFVSAAAALLLSHSPQLTAEGVRGILVGSSIDLGDRGWDFYFGAGRLDVKRALELPTFGIVNIQQPALDQGFSEGPIKIYGSAWSPILKSYSLSYGYGDNPTEWTEMDKEYFTPVIDSLLGVWQGLPEESGAYTIRLSLENRNGSIVNDYVRIFIDYSAPEISNIVVLPMIDADHQSALIQFSTDDLCEGSLFYRHRASSMEFQEAVLSFRTHDLRYNLTQDESMDLLDVKLQARNGAGLFSEDDNSGAFYSVDLTAAPINRVKYAPTNFTLPFGYMLNKTTDFNRNGKPEIILSPNDNNSIGELRLYEYDGLQFQPVFSTDTALIPRDIGDADNDGKMEVLCGFGFNSYLFESAVAGQMPGLNVQTWTGDGGIQYWASRITDLDRDGKGEILMRVVNAEAKSIPETDRFEVWETTSDNHFEFVAALQNPTPGENHYGVPHSQVGDFDNDGLLEVLLGDSDGDIYIYENNGDNIYRVTWQDSLPLLDSIEFLNAGDFDGDGVWEFIAGCHSDPSVNTEHEYDARHWYYRIYNSTGNDVYEHIWEKRFFGFESLKEFKSGISSGDVDADGRDEIFICVFPDFYVVEAVDPRNYELSYHHSTVQSGGAIVVDGNGNGKKEFWIGDGYETRGFELAGDLTGPAVPVGVTAQPLNEKQILVKWHAADGIDHFIVHRGVEETFLSPFVTVNDPVFWDENVVSGQIYYYAVQAVDVQASPSHSQLSQVIGARPGIRPFVEKARYETRESVRLFFSEPMSGSVISASNYLIEPDIGRPTSVTLDASGQQVLLSLPVPFPQQGKYRVICYHVEDSDFTPIDSTKNSAEFDVTFQVAAPYLVDGILLPPKQIKLWFNEAMERRSVEKKENYDFGNELELASAALSPESDRAVILTFVTKQAFGAMGKTWTVRVRHVTSQRGVAIKPGRGDFISFVFSKPDLHNVFTYPNPYHPETGDGTITFANLTQQAEITIMTSQGIVIKKLSEKDGDGGAQWDLTDEHGNPVAAGIYIYYVTSDNSKALGKLAILR